jgi:hypothetical protein
MLPVSVDEFPPLQAMQAAEAPYLSREEVRRELARGLDDLEGQIVPGALAEMLFALVRYRLSLRTGDDPARLHRAAS